MPKKKVEREKKTAKTKIKKKPEKKKKIRNIGLDISPPKLSCEDKLCPWHGTLPVRKKVFTGRVVSMKADKTATVEWDYFVFIPKYERAMRKHTKVAAHLPGCLSVKKGSEVRIAECRPLSKTKHFVVVQVIK